MGNRSVTVENSQGMSKEPNPNGDLMSKIWITGSKSLSRDDVPSKEPNLNGDFPDRLSRAIDHILMMTG
ncbi:hypothetical protein SUGI_0985980 [Cryptomeria japonica]|nr:hypothetical protein SUGI_0985980 [Cryptomeria japonica]